MNNNFNLKSFLAEGKLLKEEQQITANYLYQMFQDEDLINDRREYDEEDLMNAYPGLSQSEAKKLVSLLGNESIDESSLNEGTDELPLTDEIKQDVDNAVERAIQDGEMEYLQNVGYWENDFEEYLLMSFEDQYPDVDKISKELHNYIQDKVYGE